eukprot:7013421-Prymnesium_polylepis.2
MIATTAVIAHAPPSSGVSTTIACCSRLLPSFCGMIIVMPTSLRYGVEKRLYSSRSVVICTASRTARAASQDRRRSGACTARDNDVNRKAVVRALSRRIAKQWCVR